MWSIMSRKNHSPLIFDHKTDVVVLTENLPMTSDPDITGMIPGEVGFLTVPRVMFSLGGSYTLII